jgi:hypothetical protein
MQVGFGVSYQFSHVWKLIRRLEAHLTFLDEGGFLPIPTRRRTWAPAGHTPIIPYTYTHDCISTLAALTVSPKGQHMGLYLLFQPNNFQAMDMADFLRALLRLLRDTRELRSRPMPIPAGCDAPRRSCVCS